MNQVTLKSLAEELALVSESRNSDSFLQARKITLDEKANVILVTKNNHDSEFGFSISINTNKKLNRQFAYFNLIKKNNFDTFEKVTSLGKPVDVDQEFYFYHVCEELEKITQLF